MRAAQVQARVSVDTPLSLGDDRDDAAEIHVVEPRIDDIWVGDVDAKEEQVVFRECAGELKERLTVSPLQQAQRDVVSVGELHGAWQRERIVVLAHIDRTDSHSFTFGHKRVTAFIPATRLTCPPFSTTSSLSSLLTSCVSLCVASYGAMWSCWAIVFITGHSICLRSTTRPPTFSSPFISLFAHIKSFVVCRKHSPGKGIWSLVHLLNSR